MKTEACSVLRNGQGKSATTILTEGGYIYPIVSSTCYNDRFRIKSAPYVFGRGVRPMHQSTLTLGKPPWDCSEDYKTTSNQVTLLNSISILIISLLKKY